VRQDQNTFSDKIVTAKIPRAVGTALPELFVIGLPKERGLPKFWMALTSLASLWLPFWEAAAPKKSLCHFPYLFEG